MRSLKMLGGALTLGALAFVLSSCSSTGGGTAPLSFSLLVPSGITAHATLQAKDGSVLQTQAVPAGTKEVSFTGAPADSLVTVSMEAPYQNANSQVDYLNLTLPASVVAGHQVYLVYPIDNSVTVNVTVNCPTGASSVDWWASGSDSGSATCPTGSITLNTSSSALQSDGTLSMVLIAYDSSNNPVDFATKLDQNIASGAFTVATSDWSGKAPATNHATFDFPAIQTNESASASVSASVVRKGQPFDVVPYQSANTSTVGDSSLTLSGPGVPVSGAQYELMEQYSRSFTSSAGVNWGSASGRVHQVSALPFNETVNAGTDLWPAIADAHWVANGGSPTITYATNAGTKAATYAVADVRTNDSTGSPTVTKEWIFFGDPSAFSGTIQFPDMPSSLSAYVPTPVTTATPGITDEASFIFTDFQLPPYLLGLTPGFYAPNLGLPTSYHVLEVSSNHVTTSSLKRSGRPHFGLR